MRAVQQQPLQLPEHLGGKGPQRARRVGDLRPIETTYRQKAVSSDFGTFGWLTGPSPFWKVADQHVISDRWLVDVMWAHLGNNFVLDFHEDALRDVQAASGDHDRRCGAARSRRRRSCARPTASTSSAATSCPATLGGDHSFKFGYRWRSAHSTSLNHRGGFIDARFTQRRRRTRPTSGATSTPSRTSTPTRSTCRTPTRRTA